VGGVFSCVENDQFPIVITSFVTYRYLFIVFLLLECTYIIYFLFVYLMRVIQVVKSICEPLKKFMIIIL